MIFSYGYNIYLSPVKTRRPVNINSVSRPTETALFADAAQVNIFQAPASPTHPMFEEFYYLDLETNYSNFNNQPNGHFRHSQKANVTFCRWPCGNGKHGARLAGQKIARPKYRPVAAGDFAGAVRAEVYASASSLIRAARRADKSEA